VRRATKTRPPAGADEIAHDPRLLALFDSLPASVRSQSAKAYRLWRADPNHPSLNFKRIHPTEPIYSLRVSRDYRALGLRDGDVVTWFWIGSHGDYDKLL
jgi:hypothetical protein